MDNLLDSGFDALGLTRDFGDFSDGALPRAAGSIEVRAEFFQLFQRGLVIVVVSQRAQCRCNPNAVPLSVTPFRLVRLNRTCSFRLRFEGRRLR